MANLTGDDGGNFIEGTDQADLIKGLGGDDLLFGEDGDDTVLGGDGDDTASLDRYDTGADLTFVVTDTTTSTTLVGDGSRVVDVENFVLGGGDGDDTFVTLDGDDRLSGG